MTTTAQKNAVATMTRTAPTMRKRHAVRWAIAITLTLGAAALSAAPLRSLIEQSMLWHMVVQMPLLVLAGWVSANLGSGRAPLRPSAWNQFGLTGGVAALVVLAYWMLPSSIDRALIVPRADGFKLISLWVCGLCLRRCADHAPLPLQLFFVGTALPMLVWSGLYFSNTDLRLCNAYSLESQIAAGRGLAGLGGALGAWWTLNAVMALRSQSQAGGRARLS
jgi:hypothetical protein